MSSSSLSRQFVANSPVARLEALTASRPQSISNALPAPVMVLLSIFSVQVGAAVAKPLLATHSAFAIVFLRTAFAAMVLWLVAPPRLRQYSSRQWCCAGLLGLAIAILNVGFYQSVSRIPMGVTMTIELLGPLAVAVAASRRTKDLIWPLLALGAILLLVPTGSLSSLSASGMAFAFLAATAWAAYLILAKQTTLMFSGNVGLTLAMTFCTLAILPFGLISGGSSLLDFPLLVSGFWVSVLSTIAPFSLEFLALKRMSSRTFGVLLSGEPAAAAVVAFFMLHEHLNLRAWAALILVSIASIGVMSERE